MKVMLKSLPLVLALQLLAGCATPMHKSIASIRPENLEQKGMIVGHMNYSNTQTKEFLGGLFGPNFRAYATRLGDQKKVYEVWVENKDDGYFGWLVEPGTYWVHGCEIKDLNGETTLNDLKPNLEAKSHLIAQRWEVVRALESLRQKTSITHADISTVREIASVEMSVEKDD